ncbi:unnamed protein product [Rotaria socialis]
MCIRCHSRLTISRRRNYFFHAIFVILCISSFLALKKTKTNSSASIHAHTVSTFQNILINKTTLNCVGDPLKKWCENQVQLCNSSLTVYNKLFVLTRAIILQPQYAKGKLIGGEDIQTVLNQPEQNEYFQFEKDFIKLSCNVENIQENIPNSHLLNVFSSLTTYETHPVTQIINETTIAVNRQDYANFYHTITDLYTVYLLCCFFRRDPKSVRILFLDAHPKGSLDILWSQLFHSYTRLGELKASPSIFYRELIWSQPQSQSEIDVQRYRKSAPSCFVKFREHVLKQFNINYKENEKVNCQALNVFFLVRHNYVAHPRNPSGKITRQLTNEQQILDDLKMKFSKYPNVNFSFNHFEESSMEQQLNVISQTDIFIGVHGAGLTHVLFMKPNRCLIELTTLLWESQHHFELMASINSINYRRCLTTDGSQDTSQTIFECVKSKIDRMCSLAPVQNDAQPIFSTLPRINGSISNSSIAF